MLTYPVMEIFSSIQGEGAHAGEEALFLRLAGCDVGCVWCDVKESWDKDMHPRMQIPDIIRHLKNAETLYGGTGSKNRNVVITGGEPCMYDLRELCMALRDEAFSIWLESSGAYPIMGDFDWICISPKKFKEALPESLESANELKVIVYNKSDLVWARKFEDQVASSCQKFLQPEWSRRKEMMHLLASQTDLLNDWKISIQRHNYLSLP